MKPIIVAAALAAVISTTPSASADETWLPPHKEQCSVEPGQDCGADVQCPSDKPYALSGGGGIPKVSDPDHRLAMTMNVAISPNAWRVRWRNMGTGKVEATVMIRALCTDDGEAWGK